MGKSTINDYVQSLCEFTRGYIIYPSFEVTSFESYPEGAFPGGKCPSVPEIPGANPFVEDGRQEECSWLSEGPLFYPYPRSKNTMLSFWFPLRLVYRSHQYFLSLDFPHYNQIWSNLYHILPYHIISLKFPRFFVFKSRFVMVIYPALVSTSLYHSTSPSTSYPIF